jgi:DNA-binding CsgD family transcriptional regulator
VRPRRHTLLHTGPRHAARPPGGGAGRPAGQPRRGLTPREAEVLALVAAGRSNRQIAQLLFISLKTASVHVSNILAKLGVSGRLEAAAVAHRLGLDTDSTHA